MNKKKISMGVIIIVPIIIIVLIIVYVCLRMLNKNPYSDYEEYRGRFDNIVVDENFVINRYFKQIAEIVKNYDVSALQAIIDENDSKYYIMGSRRFS